MGYYNKKEAKPNWLCLFWTVCFFSFALPVKLSIPAGGHVFILFKGAGKAHCGVEADLYGDLLNGHIGIQEQLFGVFNPHLGDMVHQAEASILLKQGEEIGPGFAKNAAEGFHAQVDIAVMLVNVTEHIALKAAFRLLVLSGIQGAHFNRQLLYTRIHLFRLRPLLEQIERFVKHPLQPRGVCQHIGGAEHGAGKLVQQAL